MSIRVSTALTAGLLSALLAASSIATVHAGEGCEQGKKKDKATSTHWCPATASQRPATRADVRP
jgi:hypothetical protein